jgi:hypothetical protein
MSERRRSDVKAEATSKLSRLQRRILVAALANREAEGRTFDMADGADLFYSEILATLYQFPMRKGYALGPRALPCCRIFSRDQIGLARYRSVVPAVSKSVLRLAKRGLVRWVTSQHSTWSGCNLTPLGVEIARQLQTDITG